MLFFLENLLKLPKVSIRNVAQEGTEVFLKLKSFIRKFSNTNSRTNSF